MSGTVAWRNRAPFSAGGSLPFQESPWSVSLVSSGVDATVVRALMVLALVTLLGRWNWWLPPGVAKVLRVEPSPLAPRQLGD